MRKHPSKYLVNVKSNRSIRQDILDLLDNWISCDAIMTKLNLARGTVQFYLQRGIYHKLIEVKHIKCDGRGRPHSQFRKVI